MPRDLIGVDSDLIRGCRVLIVAFANLIAVFRKWIDEPSDLGRGRHEGVWRRPRIAVARTAVGPACSSRPAVSQQTPTPSSNYVDGHGDPCYLAPNRWNLEKVQERFPDVIFEETRERT